MWATSQRRQIVSSAAAAAERAGHGRVVQILVDFTAELVVLITLGFLRSNKQNSSQAFRSFATFHKSF